MKEKSVLKSANVVKKSDPVELGLQITEKEYRELDYPSYSLLSNVSKSNALAVGGDKVDIDDLDGIIIGSIVDSIITDGGLPDNLIMLSKKPSGKPLMIIKALYKRKDLIHEYVLSPKNNKIIEEELNNFEYYKTSSFSSRLSKLTQYKTYAKALSKYGEKAMFVTKYQHDIAISISNNLIIRYPFLLEEDNLITQIKLIGEVNGVKIKGMLDFIYINHKEHKIIPFDLKTGINPHYSFFEKGYLAWNYYIQASLYRTLLEDYIRKNHSEYKEYTIDNFRFMYCGRADRLPIIYRVSDKLHKAGYSGFEYKNKYYPGINELIEDYIYYKENPNSLYKKGYEVDEKDFDDSFI